MKAITIYIVLLFYTAISYGQVNLFEAFPIIKIERAKGLHYWQIDQIELITRGDSTLARTFFFQRTSHVRELQKDSIEILLNKKQKTFATQFIELAKSEASYYHTIGLDSEDEECPYYQVILWNTNDVSRSIIESTGLRYPFEGNKKGEFNMFFRGTDRLDSLTFENLDSCFFGAFYKAREWNQNELKDSLYSLLNDFWIVEGKSRKPKSGDTLTLTRLSDKSDEYHWRFEPSKTFNSKKKSKINLENSKTYSIDTRTDPPVLRIDAGFKTRKNGGLEIANNRKSFGIVDSDKSKITLVIWDLE